MVHIFVLGVLPQGPLSPIARAPVARLLQVFLQVHQGHMTLLHMSCLRMAPLLPGGSTSSNTSSHWLPKTLKRKSSKLWVITFQIDGSGGQWKIDGS